MNDFRIAVFLSVARNLSFTKASNELLISQPAISKHIRELELHYGVQLFERANNKVILTDAAKTFIQYAETIHQSYRELEYEMNRFADRDGGAIEIGASTTIAQYLLPRIISKYKELNPNIALSLITGNTEYIESLIANRIVDVGIVEGASHKREFNYTLFTKDELVLVTSPSNIKTDEIAIEELSQLPLVLREDGSGTLEVIKRVLSSHKVKYSDLNIVMRLGSSEAIKRYVAAGDSYAIISIAAVVDELRRDELSVVEIMGVDMPREFSFITNSGCQDRLVDNFIEFAKSSYNNLL